MYSVRFLWVTVSLVKHKVWRKGLQITQNGVKKCFKSKVSQSVSTETFKCPSINMIEM